MIGLFVDGIIFGVWRMRMLPFMGENSSNSFDWHGGGDEWKIIKEHIVYENVYVYDNLLLHIIR